MAVAEIVVREAEFLAAEQQRDGRLRERAADQAPAIFEAADGVVQLAMAHRGGAHHQAAIGDGGGQGGKLFGRAQQRGGADGRAGLAECHVVGVDHAEAREPEIRHGAGGGPHVERVARLHQNHAEIAFPVDCDASIVAQTGRKW